METLYGRTGLISSIISKAREKVRAYYALAGEPEAVKRDVVWLLTKSHFAYGGINLRVYFTVVYRILLTISL